MEEISEWREDGGTVGRTHQRRRQKQMRKNKTANCK